MMRNDDAALAGLALIAGLAMLIAIRATLIAIDRTLEAEEARADSIQLRGMVLHLASNAGSMVNAVGRWLDSADIDGQVRAERGKAGTVASNQ